MAKLKLADLPTELQEVLVGPQRKQRAQTSMEIIRKESIKCLATIHHLSASDRERVLNHAMKVNKI